MSILQGSSTGSTRGFYPKVINGSLRFNDDDGAYLTLTPTGTSGGRTKFTYSGWVKIGTLSTSNGFHLLNAPYASNLNGSLLMIDSNDEFYAQFRVYTTGSQGTFDAECYSNMKFRDPSAWYHIVFAYDSTDSTAANRMKLWVNGVSQTFRLQDNPGSSTAQYLGSEFDHNIGRWLGSSHGNTDGYMANVHFIDGQALTADDFGETKNGVWVAKDYAGTFGTNGFYLTFEDDTQVEAFNTNIYRGNGGTVTQEFGFDPDLVWYKNRSRANTYHYLFDTVRGADKALYSNLTSSEDSQFPTYNQQLFIPNGSQIVRTIGDHLNYDGDTYVAWAWDAGANNAVIGHSSVTYTGSGTDNMEVSGFPFSPDLLWIKERNGTEYHNFFDTVRGSNKILFSNVTNAEVTDDNRVTSFTSNGFKVGTDSATNTSGDTYVAWAWDAGDSDPVSNTDGSITSTVKTNGDFSIITYSGNGTNNSTVGTGLSGTPDFVLCKNRSNGTDQWATWHKDLTSIQYYIQINTTGGEVNGSDRWGTNEPSGLATGLMNLGYAGSTNNGSSNYVMYAWRNVTGKQKFGTYAGTGSDVTVNVGFRPGFLLVKWTGGGGASAENWAIVDASRDPINNLTKGLFPNTSGAEQDSALNNEVEFTSTGFVVKNTDARWNANGGTYIYAAFAGSYSDYITDYNTDGSIDSRVKASDTTGFSVVSYDGSSSAGTIGHGLSSAPDFIVVKNRDAGFSWTCYHSGLDATAPEDYYIQLDNTGARTSTTDWNSTAPTSSVFSVNGAEGRINRINERFIAYCWTETTGYSKFGSYTGTGSAGNSITGLGFTPAFLMIKGSDVAEHWMMYDNTRSVVNPIDDYLLANSSNAEATGQTARSVDFDSDGFTVDGTGTEVNQSGKTYIYAAFADTREAAFWLDQSGNDNDWQPNNLDHNDTVLDSPTDNFATWNPIAPYSGSTYSEGNLKVTTGSSQYGPVLSTIAVSSGKYYVEFTQGSGSYTQLGCVSTDKTLSTTIGLGSGNNSFAYVQNDGSFRQGSVTTSGYGDTWTTGDVIGMALDLDNDEVTYYKNGVSQGTVSILNASVGLTSGKTYFIALSDNDAGGGTTVTANFGQQPFKYDPPA